MRPQSARTTRRYRENTLILETDIETEEGAVTLIEFMPPRRTVSDLVRIVVGKRGTVAMRTELIIRFDYGSLDRLGSRTREDGTLSAIVGAGHGCLRTPVPLRGEGRKTVGEFTVSAGDTVPFVLTYGASHLEPPAAIDPIAALADTEAFWTETGRASFTEPTNGRSRYCARSSP